MVLRIFVVLCSVASLGLATNSPAANAQQGSASGEDPVSEEEAAVHQEYLMQQEQFDELELLLEGLDVSDYESGQSAYEVQMQAIERFREQHFPSDSEQ